MAKKKNDVAKKLVVGTVVAATLANPIATIAHAASDTTARSNYSSLMATEDDTEKDTDEEVDEDIQVDENTQENGDSEVDSAEESHKEIEAIAGVSVEQMQEDFLAEAQNAAEAVLEETPNISMLSLDQSEDYIFLSNIPYDSTSKPGYKEIQVDKNIDGGLITLHVNGEVATFKKGMAAHATSNLIYDVSSYTAQYPILDTYMGIDAAQGTKGNVKFTIYGSNDNSQWDVLYQSNAVTAADEAIHVSIDVSNYQYIRLHANQNGVNANDHAVYGGLKLATKDYTESAFRYQDIKTLEEYDAELSKYSADYNYQNNKHMVLEREFVKRIGYQSIQNAYIEDRENMGAMLDWLMKDSNALELFIEAGGYYSGSGYRALTTLSTLYSVYKDDVADITHKKMLLATAAAYSRDVRNYLVDFGGTSLASDPVERYRIMKKLYETGRFVKPSEFENYPMELVRIVMGVRICDDEIEWLRNYVDVKYGNDIENSGRYRGYGFVRYFKGNLANPDYYNPDNYAQWNEKYKFDGTGLDQNEPNGYGKISQARVWMMIEAGGICWGISGVGNAVNNVQGIPSLHTYQPAHEAEMSYKEVNGVGTWILNNDVNGWAKSYTYWSSTATQVRLPLEWGVMDFNTKGSGNNSTYIILAQDAFNHYDDYKQSMYYTLIANSYTDDKKVEAYKKALQAYDKNVDATYGLIKYYSSVASTTQETWLELGEYIAEKYKFFPAPMVDLSNLVKKYVTNDTYTAQLNTLTTASLQRAANATASDTTQYSDCKKIANSLLGANVVELATFSFDGEYANTVKLNSVYDDANLAIRISLDGGKSWLMFDNQGTPDKYTSAHSVKLTDDQVAQITVENGILVGLMGVPEETNYKIEIKNGETIASNVYKNDSENLLIGGNTANLEYSLDEGLTWHDYESGLNSTTRFDGDVTAWFRYKQYGAYMPGPVKEFTFTKNPDTETATYIPLQHVSLYKYSSQQNATDKAAANIIDGNYNTRWHTTWDKPDDTEKYISFEFDQVKYISQIKYLAFDTSGQMKTGNVYTSLDGEHWEKVYTYTNLPSSSAWQTINLGGSYPAKYLKIDSTESHGKYTNQVNLYFAGRMLEFYEDTTQTYKANATVSYDIPNDKKTNQNVTATLTLPEGCEAITETTHVFETNDTFEFLFKDANGVEQSVEATVDWIDKDPPTAVIEYSTKKPTNGTVEVKLVNISEKVTGETSYTFTHNDTHTFVITDEAGNTAEYTAVVSWIKTEGPVLTVSFDKDKLTNTDVVATLGGYSETDTILDGSNGTYRFEKNGTYTFRVKDEAGNISQLPVVVDWIDKEAPTATIEYSTEKPTNGAVEAKLVNISEKVTGETSYTFTQNGTHKFVITDEAGNTAEYTAEVNWIKTEGPVLSVSFDKDTLTNTDVVATLSGYSETDTILDGSNGTHRFEKNDTYTFRVQDEAGNISELPVTVDWIDKEAPTATIEYSTKTFTNDSVEVKLTNISEKVTGETSYTFTQNGTHKFVITDEAGNTAEYVAVVSWIKTEGPVLHVDFDKTSLTNTDVVATISGYSETDTILDGSDGTHCFEKNGIYTFRVEDEAGNISELPVTVNWIDKEAPTAVIEYSTRNPINGSVEATLTHISEKVTGETSYTFTQNGTHTFVITDQAGNTAEFIAEVNWIKTEGPVLSVSFDKDTLTNTDVVATLGGYSETDTILDGSDGTYRFEKNGTYTFRVQDEAGNISELPVTVDWIDKEAPTAVIEYSTTNPTNGSVVATLKDFSERNIEILSDGGVTFEFTQNGTHEFKFKDAAGNITTMIAEVTWIDKQAPVLGVTFDKTKLTNQSVTATLIGVEEGDTILGDGMATHVFDQNGVYEFVVRDAAGNESRLTVEVSWIDKVAPTADLVYSEKEWTWEDVRVSLKNISEDVVFLDGSNGEYLFTENGSYTFKLQDAAGNITEYLAEVKWIDKTRPVGIALFCFDTDYENNVEAVSLNVEPSKIEILSVNGDETNQSAKISRNGTYTFRMRMIDTGYEFEYTIEVACIGMQEPTFVEDNSNGNSNGSGNGNVSLVGKPVQQPNPTPNNSDQNTGNSTTTSGTTNNTENSTTSNATSNATSNNSTTVENTANSVTTGAINSGAQGTTEVVVDNDEIVIDANNTESDNEDSSTENNETESVTSSEANSASQAESTEANTTTKDENKGSIVPIVAGGISITGLLAAGAASIKKYFLVKFFKMK